MGSWGFGAFENDGAYDWLARVLKETVAGETRPIIRLREALRFGPEGEDEAICAAAVLLMLGRLRGQSGDGPADHVLVGLAKDAVLKDFPQSLAWLRDSAEDVLEEDLVVALFRVLDAVAGTVDGWIDPARRRNVLSSLAVGLIHLLPAARLKAGLISQAISAAPLDIRPVLFAAIGTADR